MFSDAGDDIVHRRQTALDFRNMLAVFEILLDDQTEPQGDRRRMQRFQKFITFSLLIAKKSFSRRKIALDKGLLFVQVSRKSKANAKGLKEIFPFPGIWPTSKLQNLVKLSSKKILHAPKAGHGRKSCLSVRCKLP